MMVKDHLQPRDEGRGTGGASHSQPRRIVEESREENAMLGCSTSRCQHRRDFKSVGARLEPVPTSPPTDLG